MANVVVRLQVDSLGFPKMPYFCMHAGVALLSKKIVGNL